MGYNMKIFSSVFLLVIAFGEAARLRRSPKDELIKESPPQVRDVDHIKTIVSIYGDIFDCVDIYKQPALKHPLLKKHKIQIRPNYDARNNHTTPASNINSQSKIAHESCPKETVPIRRTRKSNTVREIPVLMADNSSAAVPYVLQEKIFQNYAGYGTHPGKFHGIEAEISAHGIPEVILGQESATGIGVVNRIGVASNYDAIAAGWTVRPDRYGDGRTRFFTYWRTVDGSQRTGCDDQDCPGYVQVDPHVGPGSVLEPLSVYGGNQYYITLRISKDPKTGNWLLFQTNGGRVIFIGYWPKELFRNMQNGATNTHMNGYASHNPNLAGPPMGSGHFANEGRKRAAFIKNIKYIDENDRPQDPGKFGNYDVSYRKDCYTASSIGIEPGYEGDGYMFYYGGPAGCKG